MHVDYAIETYIKQKYPKYVDSISDLVILKNLATDEFVDLADSYKDEKISSICETMRKSTGYRNVNKGYKKITEAQKFAIANFLLEKCGSAISVIAKAFNVPEEYISNYKM